MFEGGRDINCGNKTVMEVPLPTLLTISISPLWRSMISFTMLIPSPVPGVSDAGLAR
jgi:hypothetical protein